MLLDMPLDPEAYDLVTLGLVVTGALQAENNGAASQRRAVIAGRTRAAVIESSEFFTDPALDRVPEMVEQRIPSGGAA